MAKELKLPKRFDRTPEWRKLVNQVLVCKENGMNQDAIIATVKADPHAVMRILEDEKEVSDYARRTWEGKVPTIKNIISLGLNAINETFKDIAEDDELRRSMLSKASDIKMMQAIVTELNTLLRLELGESTQNISIHKKETHTYEDTRLTLQKLQKIDPVFTYGLPAPKPNGE